MDKPKSMAPSVAKKSFCRALPRPVNGKSRRENPSEPLTACYFSTLSPE
jgi:hypothetical protein